VIRVEAWSGGIASAILIGAFAGLMSAVEPLGCRQPWRLLLFYETPSAARARPGVARVVVQDWAQAPCICRALRTRRALRQGERRLLPRSDGGSSPLLGFDVADSLGQLPAMTG
jgi:hypothetical protein